MAIYDLILKRRTIRKFKPKKVPRVILKKLINAARISPSAANLQFLEYLVVDNLKLTGKIFPHTKWAGYLKGRGSPNEHEQPPAYIVLLVNKTRTKNPDLRDIGASGQSILLAALSFGLGSCWIASIDRPAIRKVLNLSSLYQIDSVIALGYPKQKSKAIDKNSVKYWQDRSGNLVVPKRCLKSLLHFNSLRDAR